MRLSNRRHHHTRGRAPALRSTLPAPVAHGPGGVVSVYLRLARAANNVLDRRGRTPRPCSPCPRSLVNLGSGGRAAWASGWSRRRPSCRCSRERLPRGAAPPHRAALTKLPRRATLQRARPVRTRAPPAHLREFSAGRKNERHGKVVTDLKLERGGAGPREGWRGPLPARRARKASSTQVQQPVRFAIKLGRAAFAAAVFHTAPRGDPRRRGTRIGAAAGLPPGPS